VSFHAKGSPSFVNNHVRMGISAELRTIDTAFGIVASFPEYKNKPIVIGECDPESCAACLGAQYSFRNGTMYSSYTAEAFARIYDLAKKHDVNMDGAVTWAFEFEGQPPFAGFRSVASGGIDLPVMNTFRMFSKMPAQRVAVESDSAVALDDVVKTGVREKPDVSAIASSDANHLVVMVWHYHDDDLEGPSAVVALAVDGLPQQIRKARVQEYRIDEDHSNAFTVWKKMGSPEKPTAEQYAQLEKASQLKDLNDPSTAQKVPISGDVPTIGRTGHSEFNLESDGSRSIAVEKGEIHLHVNLPRAGVALLVFDYGTK
jgi:xylan 1,4-beta-xylosidase